MQRSDNQQNDVVWRFRKKVVTLQRDWETPRSVPLNLVLMFNRTIMYAKLAWVYAKASLFMKRKFRWIDLALLPFGLCVLFLLLLGKLFGLTYKQISVVSP